MLQGLLSKRLEDTMYVSFLAGCFRSIRFGLEEAHGYDKSAPETAISLSIDYCCNKLEDLTLVAIIVVNNRKGQALQFNFILEKGGFSYHPDGTFSVDYTKVRNLTHQLLIEQEDVQ